MNCSTLSSITDWDCSPAGINSFLVHAPLTLGDDGQLASFYVMQSSVDEFYLTDAHATIIHAVDHGAKILPSRIKAISKTPGARLARITEDGEIIAEGRSADLRGALWDALRLAMAISNNERIWVPKTRQERFSAQVARTLREQLLPGMLVFKPRLVGVSGHQIEFPLGILLKDSNMIRAIQPISLTEEHRLDWGFIYQSYGKLVDLKKATASDADNRLVIIERGASNDEYARAASVLSEAARVLPYVDGPNLALSVAA